MKCPASCQRADRLDRARVGLGGEDLRLGVRLADGGVELLGLEPVDLPHDLLRVGDRDAEAALRDLLEQVPVVVQGGVDVDGDAHRTRLGTVDAHARSPPRQAALRTGDDYGRAGPRAVARRRLAGGPAPDRDRRPRGQLLRARRGPGDRCSSTASAASWQSGWSNMPGVRREPPRAWRWTCPGSATPRCRARTSRSRATRAGPPSCATRWASSRRRWSATRWAASSAPSWRSSSRRACSGSCSSRPAIFWQNRRRAQPLVQLARLSDAVVAARARARHRRHRDAAGGCATPALATAGFRYPQHDLADELAHEMVRSARRTDGFLPALEALAGYDLEEELPKISCPTLIVWGAHDKLVPVKDAERLRGADPRLAARGLRAHRPRGDARAARALQPAAAGVPRGGAASSARAGRRRSAAR